MKKIAFYIGNLARGGAQRVVVNLANYFQEIGYKTVIVTTKSNECEYEYNADVGRIISDLTEEEQSQYRLCNFFLRLKKLRGIWKQEKPDLILSFMGKSNFYAIFTTIALSIPVLVSVRSAPEREYGTHISKMLAKTCFGLAAGVILQTEDALHFFPKRIQNKAVIMPNSLDARYIKERWEGMRRTEIVSVGTIDKNKNHLLLIDAFQRLKDDYPEWSVTIYGEGEQRSVLTEYVSKIGLSDRVKLPGREFKTFDKIYDASVFILTSNMEGMPNALMEAMALGLAVVSTDCPCGGPRTIIQDEINGLLIPVGDVEALEKTLRRLLGNEELREMLGKRAHKLGEELAPDKVNQMWQDYIESKMVK